MKKHFVFAALLVLLTAQLHAFNSTIYAPTNVKLYWNLTNPPVDISTNAVNPATRAIRFHFASDAYSATNQVNELNAVRASFAQWQSIPGTIVKFEEAGLVPPRADMIDRNDGTNIFYWVKSTDFVNGGTANIVGVLGEAFLGFRTDGTLFAADLVLNGRYHGWFTDFNDKNNTNLFIESTALHEIGHALGCAHASMGGATMLANGQEGIDAGAGLSLDEVAFARTTYPKSNILATLGNLKGQVTKNGSPVFGAAVVVEDAIGNLVGGTVTAQNGSYQFPALLPGTHKVRVCPLDTYTNNWWLIIGPDIQSPYYDNADTSFLPTTNFSATITAGVTNTLNFAVTNGDPAFRITQIRKPTTNSNFYSIIALPALLYPGQSNRTMGVFSENLPTNGATVTVTGDGLSIGAPTYQRGSPFAGLNGISFSIGVASNATPGLRTILVQKGTDRAYANGFVEIVSTTPDYNFDGLADPFQRQYFPLWTATNAAPNADPDGDRFPNSSEYVAGTNPTNAVSFLNIDQVTQNLSGAKITWRSVSGRRYQVSSRLQVGTGVFLNVGSPVTATNSTAQFLDGSATNGNRFYRVEALP